jgi:hypothetical protein
MCFLSQRYLGLCYSHNFFASCHGKGPSDGG